MVKTGPLNCCWPAGCCEFRGDEFFCERSRIKRDYTDGFDEACRFGKKDKRHVYDVTEMGFAAIPNYDKVRTSQYDTRVVP